MQETIDTQYKETASLNRNVSKLRKENYELRKRLERYENPDKNLDNICTQSSKERMKEKVVCNTNKKSGLKPDVLLGHEEHRKNMSVEPNVIEDCMSNYCIKCGRNLSAVEDELGYMNQKLWFEKIGKLLNENFLYLKDNFEKLCKGLKYKDYIFNFLKHPLIPSDNNASERGIKKLKIKLKILEAFWSDNGLMLFLPYILLPILNGRTNNHNSLSSGPFFLYRGGAFDIAAKLENSYDFN